MTHSRERFHQIMALCAIIAGAAHPTESQGQCTQPPSGMISWWRAEGNATDAGPGGYTGSLDDYPSQTWYATGYVGSYAFGFSGNGGGVDLGSAGELQLQSFTVEGWIRRSSTSSVSLDSGGGNGMIFSWGQGGWGFYIENDGNNNNTLALTQVGISKVNSGASITDTQWHHVAVTKDSSGNVSFYLDGEQYLAYNNYNPTFTFGTDVAIGKRSDDDLCNFYGSIDEISVYNTALSASAIASIYNARAYGKCYTPPAPPCDNSPSGILHWWKGEDNASDSIGSITGTLNNASYGAGEVGNAFSLTGDYSYVMVGNSADFQRDVFTVEGWIKRASTSTVSSDEPNGMILAWGQDGWGFYLEDDGQNNNTLALTQMGISKVNSSAPVTDTAWHHVAVTVNSTGSPNVNFYVDGTLYPAYNNYSPSYSFINDVAIGSRGDDDGCSFDGMIDELSFYNRALSQAEIQAIYEAGSSGKCSTSAPTITQQPETQTACAGNTVSISVTATGPGTLSYQWYFGANAVPAATTTTLTIYSVTSAFDGNYDVVVDNAYGTVTSSTAVLTVAAAPTITSEPQNAVVASGNSATFSVAATGGETLSYQWYDNGTLLSGQTQATLTTGTVGSYTAAVSDSCGTVTSSAATLSFGVAATISGQPQSQTVYSGTSANFSVSVSGTPPISYQWQFNDVAIPGATASSYPINNAGAANAGSYTVEVSNPYLSVSLPSPVAWWQCNDGPGASSLADSSGNGYTGALFGSPGWVTGRTGTGYALSLSGNSSQYVTTPYGGQLGDFTASAWIYTMTQPISTYNRILDKDYGGGFWMGQNETDAGQWGGGIMEGYPYGTYWSLTPNTWWHICMTRAGNVKTIYYDGVATLTETVSSAVTDTTALTIGKSPYGDFFTGYLQDVRIYNSALTAAQVSALYNGGGSGSLMSSVATLTVISGAPPTITTQPVSQTVNYCAPTTFAVGAGGASPLSYQWRLNGSSLPGATQSSYTVECPAGSNSGSYTVIVSNPYGQATSSAATLSVLPAITSGPLNQTVIDGDMISFSVAAEGTPPFTYKWAFNGATILDATNSTYTQHNMQSSYAGTYTVTIENAFGSVNSSEAVLTEWGGYFPWEIGPIIYVIGPRQDYTFRKDTTYYINSDVDLYGRTVIEGGTVIKFDDDDVTNSSLVVRGTLTCNTGPHNFAMLTSQDDDSVGVPTQVSGNANDPSTAASANPFLNLDFAEDPVSTTIRYIRFSYAFQALTTPTATANLQIWDSQFVQCGAGPTSRLKQGSSTIDLHNVLFANHAGGEAIGPVDSNAQINGEQITADVGRFCDANNAPYAVRLTNSIIVGTFGSFPVNGNIDVDITPTPPFQTVGDGKYYLASGYSNRGKGANNISAAMLAEMTLKTTFPPIAFPSNLNVVSELTLFPQAPRYSLGSAPDYGYYYDAMDYTIASATNQGEITVLSGTAIGFRNDWYTGLNLQQNSTLAACGTPLNPISFTDTSLVQEGPFAEGNTFNPEIEDGAPPGPYGGTAFFVPLPTPDDTVDAPPGMDFDFCNFYLRPDNFLVWAGFEPWLATSPPTAWASSIDWSLRDSNVRNGWIVLGSARDIYAYAQGSVCWTNNKFDCVNTHLDPGSSLNGPPVEAGVQIYNNLFWQGFLELTPVAGTQPYWTVKDNLFDKVQLYNDCTLPMDHNNNCYWPCLAAELYYNPNSRLVPAPTDDQILPSPPPYATGPFGSNYMNQASSLYTAQIQNKASRLATTAGLCEYTTRADQTKEPLSTTVNADIGLHYISANQGVPAATDYGIPDYIEDPNGTGTLADLAASDPAWLDTDLSGDGIVGRVKNALGMNPQDSSNPLLLKQIITGQEPQILTFNTPSLNYASLSAIGGLTLMVDGDQATSQSFGPAGDGSCLLQWDTTYEPPGQHVLQCKLTLSDPSQDQGVTTAFGNTGGYVSPNVMQFDEAYSQFDQNGATLTAYLPQQDAKYTIQLYDDDTGAFITTINGLTSSGQINELWGVTNEDGSPYIGNDVRAVYNVSLLDAPASGTSIAKIGRGIVPVSDGTFDVAIAYNNDFYSQPDGYMWLAVQYGVVDVLMQPSFDWTPYESSFNLYTDGLNEGYPGLLSTRTDVTQNLLPDLSQPHIVAGAGQMYTRNFFFWGHGSPSYLGDGLDPSQAYIDTSDVSGNLQNNYLFGYATRLQSPYRFVFLYACDTAATRDWQHAFGIRNSFKDDTLSTIGPQAFVGWKTRAPVFGNSQAGWEGAGDAFAVFYASWMLEEPLADCITYACNRNSVSPLTGSYLAYPFPVKCNRDIYTSTSNGRTIQYWSVLKTAGYLGITSTGFVNGY